MWLYVPSASLPARPDSNSALSLPVLASLSRCCTVNAKPMRLPISSASWKRRPYLMHLSGLMHEQSVLHRCAIMFARERAAKELTCSPPDTPAPTSLSPASAVVWQAIRENFGGPWLKRLSAMHQACVFSKTSATTLFSDSIPFSRRYADWVIAVRQACSRRQKLARRTEESGCLSWGTPEANQGAETAAQRPSRIETGRTTEYLGRQVAMWPTISVGDADSGQTRPSPSRCGGAEHESLRVATAMWQTPQQPQGGGTSRSGNRMGEPLLDGQARNWPTPNTADAKTSPDCPHKGGNPTLPMEAALWPTPASRDHKSGQASDETMDKNARPLNEIAERWPTPQASDAIRAEMPGEVLLESCEKQKSRPKGKPMLLGVEAYRFSLPALKRWTDGQKSSPSTRCLDPRILRRRYGETHYWPLVKNLLRFHRQTHGTPSFWLARLSPIFDGWLMGWPIGWSGCASVETASYLSRQRRHLSCWLQHFGERNHD